MTLMNKLIPNFEDRAKAVENLNSFCALVRLSSFHLCWQTWHENKLQAGANDARSDDMGRLKTAVANWLNDCGRSNARLSAGASLSANKKEGRGISHDVTGRLLCPINYDWDDPEYVTCHLFSDLRFPHPLI